MSTLRHRFRYTLDGETHDIMTNARDMAAIQVDDEPSKASGALMTYALIHAAALRLDIAGTPGDFDKFIDLLDDIDDLDGVPVGVSAGGSAELPDPIQARGSADSPSLSPSRQG